ncbi:helix-turn-helix domain-containing protein [Thetidibacter halocola]|uniref:Helix-turn-helix transcriptional regulator n=1 Tax=Thetidibacter halocola TaxID=2827239 RepID=A0A8J8B816_9RHOB|nr:helix-turn-helix transcriptional regulator [Thetidibacter halocola]MBS0122718.1 helix-turn-helix transcriptional regulator [Thetidibacter halocola]
MLGANLRRLSRQATSISALCRDLGINRTQYNRYLAGESFPRPDVLHRICDHFGVDARILLEPVENIGQSGNDLLRHEAVADFLGRSVEPLTEKEFPSGFFRFVRRSFMDEARFVQGLIYVFRRDDQTFLRGFEAKEAMSSQGLEATPPHREFRGVVMRQEEGVAALVSRRGTVTASFNFLAHIPSFENNYWVGYVTRPVRENVAGRRIERLIYEYLGRDTHKVLSAARAQGFCTASQLVPYHRQLLDLDKPLT